MDRYHQASGPKDPASDALICHQRGAFQGLQGWLSHFSTRLLRAAPPILVSTTGGGSPPPGFPRFPKHALGRDCSHQRTDASGTQCSSKAASMPRRPPTTTLARPRRLMPHPPSTQACDCHFLGQCCTIELHLLASTALLTIELAQRGVTRYATICAARDHSGGVVWRIRRSARASVSGQRQQWHGCIRGRCTPCAGLWRDPYPLPGAAEAHDGHPPTAVMQVDCSETSPASRH